METFGWEIVRQFPSPGWGELIERVLETIPYLEMKETIVSIPRLGRVDRKESIIEEGYLMPDHVFPSPGWGELIESKLFFIANKQHARNFVSIPRLGRVDRKLMTPLKLLTGRLQFVFPSPGWGELIERLVWKC